MKHGHIIVAEKFARDSVFGFAFNRDVRRIDGSISILQKILRLQHQNEEADGVLVQVLTIAVGIDDSRTLSAMQDLASQPWQYNHVHDGVDAVVLWEHIIAGRSKTMGKHDTTTLQAMKRLSSALIHRKKRPNTDGLVRAVEILTDEIRIRVQFCGGAKHPETLDAVKRLGEVLWTRLKRLTEGLVCLKRVYDGFAMVYGSRDEKTLWAGYQLSCVYMEMELYGECVRVSKKVLKGWEWLVEKDRVGLAKGQVEIARLVEQIVAGLTGMGNVEEGNVLRSSYFL